MQNCRLANVMAVHEGQRIRVQRCHGANTFQQRDQTVSGLYGGSKQLQAIRIGRTNFNRITAQFNAASAIATVRHLDQNGTLSIAGHMICSVRSSQGFFLASPRLRIRRTASHMKHDGTCKFEKQKRRE